MECKKRIKNMYKISIYVNNKRSERFVYDFFGIISSKKDFDIMKKKR